MLVEITYYYLKMAAGAIRVCVLEGIYAKMTELGLPLSLAVELQYRGTFALTHPYGQRA